MKLSDFDYELPKELIAHEPSPLRGSSRLLVSDGSTVEHKKFDSLIDYLKEGDVLVVNESKVLKAQIDARKETGGKVSVMIVSKKEESYLCKVKGHRVKEGDTLIFPGEMQGTVKKVSISDFLISFNGNVDELLSEFGREPLPPYISKDSSIPENLIRYQTVYSTTPGSLAAPTAGLHFSDELITLIEEKGVKIAKLTLHVSFGTFNSIKVDNPEEHKMDPEQYFVSKEAADLINNRKGRLVVIGTTSLKTLESAATEDGVIKEGMNWSDLFIYPGYNFKSKPDAMVTNFHLPKSTLLMLVSAYYGREKILSLYKLAIKEKYRFFSFGDAMLLILRN